MRHSERSPEWSGWGSRDMDGKAGGRAKREVSESNPDVKPSDNFSASLDFASLRLGWRIDRMRNRIVAALLVIPSVMRDLTNDEPFTIPL
jgi:hypothetical protein